MVAEEQTDEQTARQ